MSDHPRAADAPMPSVMQFDEAGLRDLLRRAIDNRGRDWARGLLIETVVKNSDTMLDWFTITQARAAATTGEPTHFRLLDLNDEEWCVFEERHADEGLDRNTAEHPEYAPFTLVPLYAAPAPQVAARTEERDAATPIPASAQHEPPYPNHETVVMSIRDPHLTVHRASERCAQEAPHPIAECGEFVLLEARIKELEFERDTAVRYSERTEQLEEAHKAITAHSAALVTENDQLRTQVLKSQVASLSAALDAAKKWIPDGEIQSVTIRALPTGDAPR